jgi:mono/diheme cytochrome c family protein
MNRVLSVAALMVASLGLGMGLAAGAARLQPIASPTFTEAQAKRGEASYADKCVGCHGDDLTNGEFAPPLKGRAFREHWGGKGLDGPFMVMSTTMPPDNPGGLGAATYTDVLAFILSKNGVAPSSQELPGDVEKLKGMAAPQ